jgi:hypothetical protein
MAEKIRALIIYEILGNPPEHIKKALEDFIKKVGDNPGVELVSFLVHEPKKIEEKNIKEIYSTFGECELLLDDLKILLLTVLNTMPATVEILSPGELKFKNFDLSETLNILTAKLHRYDEIAKVITVDNQHLNTRIQELKNKIEDLEKKD